MRPRITKLLRTRVLLGMTMVSQLRVSTRVERQPTSETRPFFSPTRIQSPACTEPSNCRASPAMTFPRVSCRERPMTAVMTVEVAISPETLNPS